MEKRMVLEWWYIRIRVFTKANGIMNKNMVMELRNFQMDAFIKDNMSMASLKVLGFMHGLMVSIMMDNG